MDTYSKYELAGDVYKKQEVDNKYADSDRVYVYDSDGNWTVGKYIGPGVYNKDRITIQVEMEVDPQNVLGEQAIFDKDFNIHNLLTIDKAEEVEETLAEAINDNTDPLVSIETGYGYYYTFIKGGTIDG